MNKLFFTCVSFLMLFCLSSCDPSQSAIKDLESLTNDIEANSQSYTEEDWQNVDNSFTAIETELSKHEYTDEELKEIGRLKGRYMALRAKQSVKDFEKQVKDISKEIEGGIEGFIDALSEDSEQDNTPR